MDFKIEDIKFGLMVIGPTEKGDVKSVLHFVGYMDEPTEREINDLRRELKENAEFGLTEIADRLEILPAPDDVIKDIIKIYNN